MSTTAIVGASGPLGTLLTDTLARAGRHVRPLSRRAAEHADRVDVIDCDATSVLRGMDEVIYCAWNTTDRTPASQRLHVDAAARWADASERAGIPFVFTSTVLAAGRNTSSYGLHKFLAEQAVTARGGIALRIGLVTDDAYPFLATRVRNVCRRFPVVALALDVPVLAVGSPAVASAITAELDSARAGSVVWLAPDVPASLRDVATWGEYEDRRAARQLGSGRLLNLVASLPLHRGRIGRLVDGASGLLANPTRPVHMALPTSGPVDSMSWQEPLRRS